MACFGSSTSLRDASRLLRCAPHFFASQKSLRALTPPCVKSGRGGAGHFRPAERKPLMYTSTTQPRNSGPEPLRAPASPRGTSSTAPRPFGLRVRVSLDTTQRFLFGDDGPSLPTRLAEELCVLVAASSFRISASTRSWTAPFPRFSAISAWASGPAHVVPLSMQRRLSPAAPSVASFSHAWLSRLPISPFGSRVSARTRSVPFGSNASRSKTTVGLSALNSRRCIANVASRNLGVVPRLRSPANER